jgi:dihydrofolate reductase
MAKLIYFTPTSLDGFLAGEGGDMNWSAPDAETFAFMTDLMRPIGAYLYGRKTYTTMAVWQTPEAIAPTPAYMAFGRMWQAAEKIVYSRTLQGVSTPKTRLEGTFDPEAVRDLKARSAHDISVGGPTLAAEALRAGVVDEIRLIFVPALIGGGVKVLPEKFGARLELIEEQRLGSGWVYVRYRTAAVS